MLSRVLGLMSTRESMLGRGLGTGGAGEEETVGLFTDELAVDGVLEVLVEGSDTGLALGPEKGKRKKKSYKVDS